MKSRASFKTKASSKTTAILALVLLPALLLLPGGAPAPATAQASTQTVYGTIVDEAGTPLPKVTIRIKTLVGSPIVLKSKTNKKGKYRLVLPTHKYDFDMTLEKEGYHTHFETVSFAMLRNGETSTVKNFTLLTTAAVARRALDQAASGQIMTGIDSAAVKAFNRAAKAYNSGDLDAARDALEEALEADSAIAPARRMLATVHFRQERFAEAITEARIIVDLADEDREMWEILRDSAKAVGDEETQRTAESALFATN